MNVSKPVQGNPGVPRMTLHGTNARGCIKYYLRSSGCVPFFFSVSAWTRKIRGRSNRTHNVSMSWKSEVGDHLAHDSTTWTQTVPSTIISLFSALSVSIPSPTRSQYYVPLKISPPITHLQAQLCQIEKKTTHCVSAVRLTFWFRSTCRCTIKVFSSKSH